MKLTDKHVSDTRLQEFIEWAESRSFPIPSIRRLMHDMVLAVLELKQRRAEDRHNEKA